MCHKSDNQLITIHKCKCSIHPSTRTVSSVRSFDTRAARLHVASPISLGGLFSLQSYTASYAQQDIRLKASRDPLRRSAHVHLSIRTYASTLSTRDISPLQMVDADSSICFQRGLRSRLMTYATMSAKNETNTCERTSDVKNAENVPSGF